VSPELIKTFRSSRHGELSGYTESFYNFTVYFVDERECAITIFSNIRDIIIIIRQQDRIKDMEIIGLHPFPIHSLVKHVARALTSFTHDQGSSQNFFFVFCFFFLGGGV